MSAPSRPTLSRGFLVSVVVCALVLIGLRAALRPDYSRRNVRVFTEMMVSPARETFSPSACLPGGLTEQALQPGVVLRGEGRFPYGLGPEEALRAGRELASPIPLDDPEARAHGAELYRVYCVVCHAADGGGMGSVVQRGMLPPPSLLGARAQQMADGEMFHILTRGQGNMASYAAQLTITERWQAIAHVRSIQQVMQ